MSVIDSLKNDLLRPNVPDTTVVTDYLLIGGNFASVNIDSGAVYIRKGVEKSLKTNNYKIVKAYGNLGLIHFYKSNSDSARHYYDKALKFLDKKDNKLERSTIYANYSLSYQNSSEHEKRIEYNQKAIDLVEDDPKEVCLLYINHSLILGELGDEKKAVEYLKKALETSDISNDYRVKAAALKRLAHYSMKNGQLDSARVYLEQGLELCDILQSPETNYHIYSELGKLYDELKLFDKAEDALVKANRYALERDHKYETMASYIFLGNHEFLKENYDKAILYLKKFDNVYKNNIEPKLGVEAYSIWSMAEQKKGNYKRSNELFQKYTKLRDSIFSAESKEAVANAEAKYQTEKKDKEIATQQLALQEQEAEIQAKKAQNNYMLGAILFLVATTTLLVFLLKQRQKRKNQELLTLKREFQIKTLESLIEGEEKERLRVAKELHDGVNGDLAAIKYKLSSLLELNNTVIKEAITMIDDSCKQVRAISHNLIPPSLENFDLLEATQIYCANLNDVTTDITIYFQHLGETVTMPKKAEVNAFRIIQELVNNAVRHAEASNINVQISARENTVQITVEDDGKGFDSDKIESDGIGLSNVQSRTDYLNATTDFISNDKGTSYTIDINKELLNGD
ncbi:MULTISPECIES: ATP-binding protein [Flavobacteriaceae]|uniref:tetratricopeptide repeat-containing sensor histidine kinase n=1 Tax=Flavobacteriaceae TaxID=49546 RepID=UPI00149285D2|nr:MULTISPECIES: ATP-binding protein [Allomuricauda]MDC6366964.1 ATP-binding protein [Muricauda sp. AC10]